MPKINFFSLKFFFNTFDGKCKCGPKETSKTVDFKKLINMKTNKQVPHFAKIIGGANIS